MNLRYDFIFFLFFITKIAIGQEVLKEGPIGGGFGYSNIITEVEADYFPNNFSELINDLNNASSGDIVYIKESVIIEIPIKVGYNNIDELVHSYQSLVIKDGVTLASNRGNGESEGAIIKLKFECLQPNDITTFDNDIIKLQDNGRITGLRIIGSNRSNNQCNVSTLRKYRGVVTNTGINGRNNYEIDNCEIYDWPESAIVIHTMSNYSYYTPNDLVIGSFDKNQNIHHNKIYNNNGSLGYGIQLTNTAEPFIENNIFENNRHSIAGGGISNKTTDPCEYNQSYFAKYNLILKKVHDRHPVFDMHAGFENTNCENEFYGGDLIIIDNNTFLNDIENEDTSNNSTTYRGRSIKLRGVPKTKAIIKGNNFKRPNTRCEAVIQAPFHKNERRDNGTLIPVDSCNVDENFELIDNEFNQQNLRVWSISWSGSSSWAPISHSVKLFEDLNFEDFDGDGKTDVFYTDNGFWYIAYGGHTPIYKLNASNIRATGMTMQDFNGDGGADLLYVGSDLNIYVAYKYDKDNRETGFRPIYNGDTGLNANSLSDLKFGDFNGDGKTDIFAVDNNSYIRVAYSIGDITDPNPQFSDWQYLKDFLKIDEVNDIEDITITDLDLDGKSDIVYRDPNENAIKVRYSNHLGGHSGNSAEVTDEKPVIGGTQLPINRLRFGDFDGAVDANEIKKGKDVLYADSTGELRVAYNRGNRDQVFEPMTKLLETNFSENQLRFRDFNGDGITDIFTTLNLNDYTLIESLQTRSQHSIKKSSTIVDNFQQEINFYPNPFQEELNINILNPESVKNISIFDIRGVRVFNQNLLKKENTLYLNSLNQHQFYFLIIENKDGSLIRKKIYKRN